MCPGPMQDMVVRRLLEVLHQQCGALCQKKPVSSILRGLKPHELVSFSFSRHIDEWATVAPLLLKLLATVASVNLSGTVAASDVAGICTAGAVLLRQRNVHMSALHHVAGLILFHGNASKLVRHQLICVVHYYYSNVFLIQQAHVRLNHLQMAVSPDATLNKVKQLAAGFDEKVLRWKDDISRYHSGRC